MNRLAKGSWKNAAAASAVATILITFANTARSQERLVPAAPDPNKLIIQAPPFEVKKLEIQGKAVIHRLEMPNMQVPIAQPAAMDPNKLARLTIEEFRPTFRNELRLLTSAADLTPTQRREIAIAVGQTIKGNVANMAANNQLNPTVRMNAVATDPRKMIRMHLQLAIRGKLTPEQVARYKAELDRKEQARREVVILNIVAGLDKHLKLDTDQRDKLCTSLRTHWDDRDYPSLEASIPYDQYVSIIATAYIGPYLNPDQLKTWRSLQKYHLASVNYRQVDQANPGYHGVRLPMIEDDDDDEDVKLALAEEIKK